jgi:hypothetical protein
MLFAIIAEIIKKSFQKYFKEIIKVLLDKYFFKKSIVRLKLLTYFLPDLFGLLVEMTKLKLKTFWATIKVDKNNS